MLENPESDDNVWRRDGQLCSTKLRTRPGWLSGDDAVMNDLALLVLSTSLLERCGAVPRALARGEPFGVRGQTRRRLPSLAGFWGGRDIETTAIVTYAAVTPPHAAALFWRHFGVLLFAVCNRVAFARSACSGAHFWRPCSLACMAGPGRAFLFHDMVVYPLRFASDSAAQLSGRGGPNSACEVILAMFRVSDQGFVHSMTSLSPLMWAACVGAHGCASVVVYTV